ncbi:MAG: tetraacyldisaccharide 4'-kinase [Acidobacteriaceae bacterium]|nr:tetraacyldisaccharide 4'-kinase [Acidobacteriaceae bacterium]
MTPRRALLPLVPLYAAAVAAKNALYATGLLRPKQLAWPVISVGNLSTGGAGKTPFVLALSKLLAAAGWHADVLTRGYGRTGTAVTRVNPLGSAAEFGDEPMLLARAGLPVFVGASRYRAGLLAESQTPAGKSLHLLDDGMQHRKLARQVEIVLLLQADFNDHLLPAGNLREPLSALRRADIIVLRAEDAALEARVRHLLGPRRNPIFWRVQRSLRFTTMEGVPTEVPSRPLAFCALARPEAFLESLRAAGCKPVTMAAAQDHHMYTARDLQSLAARAIAQRATSFVTTAKDACKLESVLLFTLTQHAPVLIAELVTTIQDEPAAAQLLALLDKKSPR